jgi:hypothetical protein
MHPKRRQPRLRLYGVMTWNVKSQQSEGYFVRDLFCLPCRVGVLTAVVMRSSIFRGTTPCSPIKVN